MSLLKRFGYYFIGLSIGFVIVSFFFKKKGTDEFCYMPNCRVLKDIRSKTMEIPAEISVSKEKFLKLFTDGEVIFSKSNVKAQPCKIYVVEGILEGKKVEVTLENCENKVIITHLK